MDIKNQKRVCFVVGRSGGHIFPALAIAHAVKKMSPQTQIEFIHSGRALEKTIFSKIDYPSHEIPIGFLQGESFLGKLKTLFRSLTVFFKSLLLLKKFKAEVVMGTGGALTGPVLLAGFCLRRRIVIWEGNATFGLSNKLLAPFADQIFTVFKNISDFQIEKQTHCAYPLREEIRFSPIQKQDFQFKVLICGGSQGSRLLNNVVSTALLESENWRKNIFVFHQCGKIHLDEMIQKYSSLKNVEVFGFNPFLYDYYKKADLIFSRSGSGMIAEIASVGRALVLIPLSQSAGGHQIKNALHLYKQKSVELILEEEFNVESFKDMILKLKETPAKRESLISQLKMNYPEGQGALIIARWILQS